MSFQANKASDLYGFFSLPFALATLENCRQCTRTYNISNIS